MGDEIDLTTTTAKVIYIVDQIEIVSPADVRVLQPRPAPSITLVTCFPFYFVGDAPKRFVVHASLASSHVTNKQSSSSSNRKIQRLRLEVVALNGSSSLFTRTLRGYGFSK